ncbi:hypothetical protein B566_EDAN001580 [Ephemera danica]|nr:hypothetical protein B566_EDAN001580 [Ephemera danica]
MAKSKRRSVNAKKGTTKEATSESNTLTESHGIHEFTSDDVEKLRYELLRWYDKNKRTLPWRTIAASDSSENDRAYAVLVSELMLQQTQVASVISYYTKWMEKWPSLPDLAAASLDEVTEMWTGLGYYSRGRRLHEIACKVNTELGGCMPNTAKELELLPGVGPYTAGAVASIVFSERAPVVDGNVIRVVSKAIWKLADSSVDLERPGDFNQALMELGATVVSKAIWKLADSSVDLERPGDFNQALMELGATVCTPKNPQFPGCALCLPTGKWDARLGVMNFPRKEKKTNVSQQETAVCVLHRKVCDNFEFFLEKRPQKGLLANMWQFPNIALSLGLSDREIVDAATSSLCKNYNVPEPKAQLLGRVPHQFSHISQVYVVLSVPVAQEELQTPAQAQQWVTQSALKDVAMPTGMKKVFKMFSSQDKKQPPPLKKRKVENSPAEASKKNKLVTDFFKSSKVVTKK